MPPELGPQGRTSAPGLELFDVAHLRFEEAMGLYKQEVVHVQQRIVRHVWAPAEYRPAGLDDRSTRDFWMSTRHIVRRLSFGQNGHSSRSYSAAGLSSVASNFTFAADWLMSEDHPYSERRLWTYQVKQAALVGGLRLDGILSQPEDSG